MSQSIQIENRVLVVTGASSGPDEAAARRLAADSARVVLGARRSALGVSNGSRRWRWPPM